MRGPAAIGRATRGLALPVSRTPQSQCPGSGGPAARRLAPGQPVRTPGLWRIRYRHEEGLADIDRFGGRSSGGAGPRASPFWCCARRPNGPRPSKEGWSNWWELGGSAIVARTTALIEDAARLPADGQGQFPLRRRSCGSAHRSSCGGPGAAMKLVYAAPVPYSSFAQRAHHFVAFCNRSTGGSTLWINPYPGRLPRFADLRRARPQAHAHRDEAVELLSPPAWVADPMGCAPCLRQLAWKPLLRRVAAFVEGAPLVLGHRPPSRLALELLRSAQPQASCYDAMDDFPRFYQGRARSLSLEVEDQIARRVDALVVSSRPLQDKFRRCGPDCGVGPQRARCATTTGSASPPRDAHPWLHRHHRRLVRLGPGRTNGPSFAAMALRPHRPRDGAADVSLPANVRRLGECANAEAFSRLQDFSAGLIPFKINGLTASSGSHQIL